MKIGVTGCTGRVGKILVQELQSGVWKGLTLSGGTTRTPIEAEFFITSDATELFEKSDAIIDFTLPDATMNHAQIASKTNTPLIIGTTGLSAAQEGTLKSAAQNTPILYAANMSVGVNLLFALVERAAKALEPENWDIEIFESHHKHKIDAPSGTALAIGKAAAKGRNVNLDDVKTPPYDGITGTRENGTIGFSVARGGDVVGEHTAFFFGSGERIELTHKSTNRALYAKGALKAAQWLQGKPNGLYSMQDVLGL